MSPRVLVTDGDERSTLAVVRSLGRAGLAPVVLQNRHPCLASVSKYCAGSITVPNAATDPRGWAEAVVTEAETGDYELLIPMTDMSVILTSEHRSRLERYTTLPLPTTDALTRAMDKGALLKLAERLGVPVPKSWIFESRASLDVNLNSLPYPVVVKPRWSKRVVSGRWELGSITYAHSADELNAILQPESASNDLPLVQERISGPGVGAFYLYQNGVAKASFFHRRIREKPPSGGVSVLRESIEPNPKIRDYAERILTHLKWHGVAMVEFKLDDRIGAPMLMEINARFWGSLQLAVDAGIDFPLLLCHMCMGEDLQPAQNYSAGVRSRWLLGDLDHLSARLRRSHQRLNLPEDVPGRWQVFRDFCSTGGAPTRTEVCRSDDRAPFWYELKQYVKNVLFRH